MLWEKAEQIDTNKCEDIKCYLAAIAKHEAINERNKIRPHVELDEMRPPLHLVLHTD